MSKYYILDGHKTKKADMETWVKGLGGDFRVEKDSIGDVEISTVFLGLDHNWGEGEPLLFETMVFGGELDGEQDRYTTWKEAEIGHKAMVKKVKEFIK